MVNRVFLSCATLSVPFALVGCGGGGTTASPTPTTSQGPTPHTSPGPSPTPDYPPDTSIWQWRKDSDIGIQITYDMSGNQYHSIAGGCWSLPADKGLTFTIRDDADQGVTFVDYTGDVGIKLYNKKAPGQTDKWGCLMRKSRLPVDLSKIGRMELDVKANGGPGQGAPWYAVWLVPLNSTAAYDAGHPDATAEIDLVENYAQAAFEAGPPALHNRVQSNFAECDPTIPNRQYTQGYCTASHWSENANAIDHHVTLKAEDDPANPDDGRIVRVHRCPAPATTCDDSTTFSEIKVQKSPGPQEVQPPDLWFPDWNRDIAGQYYANYWLVADIWFTSDTDFTLSVDNLKFFDNDGTEWKMPLDYSTPILEEPLSEFVTV